MNPKTLLIIDGYSLLFRAFYSTRFLSTSDGRPTNALFGFLSMFFVLVEKYQPDSIVVALDSHKPTFRHEEYAEYKGTRQETPAELIQQLVFSRELIGSLGIPTLEMDGFEADDVVGTLSRQAEENGYRTVIVTGDLDSLQLVDPSVTVVTPKQGVTEVSIYDPQAVQDRYGFGPEYIPDYKALVGDTSDNIPGVPGIGDKSATKLIQAFGPVETMMERLAEVEEKFRKKLEPALEQIPKSKRLATIVRDIPIEFDFSEYKPTAAQMQAAEAMLLDLEFKNHVKRLQKTIVPYVDGQRSLAPSATVQDEALAPTIGEEFGSFDAARAWASDKPFGLLVVPGEAKNLLESDEGTAYLVRGSEVHKTSEAIAMELFRQDPGQVLAHDCKGFYKEHDLRPPKMDTLIGGFLLQPGRGSYPLRDLIVSYLDVAPPESHEQVAAGLFRLSEVMSEKIVKEQQDRVLKEIELPLIPILAEMESYGVKLDPGFLNDFSEHLRKEIADIEAKVHELAGQKFLISSPKQLGEVLFEQMGLPNGKKTKTGWATGAEVLQELVADHPIAGAVLQYRELTKLKSTYSDSLPRMMKSDGRVHTTLNQVGAATGRLSSVDPNLQNIPIRTELGRQIRKAFVAAPGYQLASFDYSQIELRLLAHLCRDDALVSAFQDRVDVHTVTAALMFGLKNEDVSKEQRRLAKMLNYAVLYGVTDFGLAQQLGEGFGVSEAKALIQQYFERFPKVKSFTSSIVEEARKTGFTATLTGRRRYFPEIHASNRNERLYAERQAVNAPIQGSAADMAKIAMIKVRQELGGKQTRMLLQVHDELLFELDEKEAALKEPIRSAMETALPLSVPVEVDAKFGPNWNDMQPA